jgi:hypothetical protein
MTFLRFCIFYDLDPVPAAQNTLACYVAHLARTMSPVSVSIYMNIIRILHEEAGLANPLSDNYEVTMIKRGLLRVKGAPPQPKRSNDSGYSRSYLSHLRFVNQRR